MRYMTKGSKGSRLIKLFLLTGIALLSAYVVPSFATATLGQIATGITQSFAGLAKLITGASYLAGIGFALAAILKFKAHKDNPTQIPIGTPIALVFVAAALMALPTVYSSSGVTIFGTGAKGTLSGTSSFGS